MGLLDLDGLRALVTGGASGIGLATAQTLVSLGAKSQFSTRARLTITSTRRSFKQI